MKWLPTMALVLASTALAQVQAPPGIPHAIDGYLVTRQENNCLECHDSPRDIGKNRKGLPPPAPATHYGKLDSKPQISDAHFNCTSCHARK